MDLLEQINQKYKQAFLDKDEATKGVLSLVKTKISLLSIDKRAENKEVDDKDIISIMQKMVNQLNEELNGYKSAGREEQVHFIEKQKEALSSFLPKLMSDEEIINEINTLEDKSIGAIMSHFRKNFDGKCDMGRVSALAKQI